MWPFSDKYSILFEIYRLGAKLCDGSIFGKMRQLSTLALSYGAEFEDWIDYFDGGGQYPTPLHMLASTIRRCPRFSLEQEIEYLLGKGCDINARDQQGRTPLLCSTSLAGGKYFEVWIRCGADPYLYGEEGGLLHVLITGLDCIHESGIPLDSVLSDLRSSAKTLLKAGCNPNRPNEWDYTPSMLMRHNKVKGSWEQWLCVLTELKIIDSVDFQDKTPDVS